MSGDYLDGDTELLARQALRDGKSLEYVAGYLHMDCELLGRLLQLPVSQPAAQRDDDSNYLWAADRLDAQL